jgi:hypothetical protein
MAHVGKDTTTGNPTEPWDPHFHPLITFSTIEGPDLVQ